MGLGDYFRKREFDKTPEPKGIKGRKSGKKLAFVVQEHHARQLHYDVRLEIDGVLKSWAVPKGPSLNPHDHHLAIQTEDHPFEYREFEGIIPEGNYGAGNVIIWDEGWVEARKGAPQDSEKTLKAELKKGHLTFILHGQKLKGEFALIKMQHIKDQDAWLMVKKGDQFASVDITKQDESVISHKTVEEIGHSLAFVDTKAQDLPSYPKKPSPWQVKPMLCTSVDQPFDRQGWLFEIKWDGYRAIASKNGDKIELYSRNSLDFKQRYVSVVEALRNLKHNVILDGEIVVVDGAGKPHFEWLQDWHKNPQGQLLYYAFDVLWCDGHDLRTVPLISRRQLLKSLLPETSTIRFSEDVVDRGIDLFEQMKKRGLEGMIAKRADSPYREDDRGQDWLKIKTVHRQEVVIGGYTEPRGSRKYLGSLLIGVFDRGKLVYVGHSGGGIPDDQRKTLLAKLVRLERSSSPFSTAPKPNAPIHWVRPELVCEMRFTEWTSDGSMRHPSFVGLRPDKDPRRVRREKLHKLPKAPSNTGGFPFEPTHLDKVFFAKHHYTKGDLFEYYQSVAAYILPYLKDRPHSLNRMPHGIKGESFYQKNNPHLPDWVPYADIFSESNNENLRWMVGGDLNTLLYMVQLGCVEINPWNSRAGHLDRPDWIVIDLDPEGVPFQGVVEVALVVKEVCDQWQIPAYPKTSGKTGIHIYIPMQAKYAYEQGRNLAHLIAIEVNKRLPKITSLERNPEKRHRKVYVDYLQNRQGQTLAAPYSVRPTPEASVSMPLHWEEIKPSLKPTDFTIFNALARVRRTGDIWKPVIGKGIDLPKILKVIEKDGA